jgi:hypothetical protein
MGAWRDVLWLQRRLKLGSEKDQKTGSSGGAPKEVIPISTVSSMNEYPGALAKGLEFLK